MADWKETKCGKCKIQRRKPICNSCIGYNKFIPMTQAYRIRSMSDEELAESRVDRIDFYTKSDIPEYIGDFAGIASSIEEAIALEMKWLQSEVGELERENDRDNFLSEEELDTFNAYIDDCMDSVAFGNSDWVKVYKKITQGRMSEKSEYRCQRFRDDYEQDY